jgi:hypothetical protein
MDGACACSEPAGCWDELVDEKVTLRARIGELEDVVKRLEATQRSLAERCCSAERELHTLAVLHAAVNAVHESLDREVVHRAIQDAVVGMGCAGHAVLDLSSDGGLAPRGWRGVEVQTLWALAEDNLLREVVRAGEGVVADGRSILTTDCGASVTACLPLWLEGRITGVLVVLGLRAGKPRLTAADRAVLRAIAAHVPGALFASRCYERDRPTSRPPGLTAPHPSKPR